MWRLVGSFREVLGPVLYSHVLSVCGSRILMLLVGELVVILGSGDACVSAVMALFVGEAGTLDENNNDRGRLREKKPGGDKFVPSLLLPLIASNTLALCIIGYMLARIGLFYL